MVMNPMVESEKNHQLNKNKCFNGVSQDHRVSNPVETTSLTPLLEIHTDDKFFTKDELSELLVGIGVFPFENQTIRGC